MERRSRNKFMQSNTIPVTSCGRRRAGGIGSGFKKISGPCKSAAKRKFKVWPSAYASGWGVRCTKAGGPSKFGGGKKKK